MSGSSRERLERVHDVMAGDVDRGELPGIVTELSRRGKQHIDAIRTVAAGSAKPMRRDTIFRIASMSKPVTTVAAIILVEESALLLAMTTDQLTARQKAGPGAMPDLFDAHGWGFGMSVVTRRDGVAEAPGQFGWHGGLGASWSEDPTEHLVGM